MASTLRSLLPRAVSRQLETYRLSGRIADFGSSKLNQLPDRVKATTDTDRIARLRTEMKPALESDPTSAAKYADLDYWLLYNVDRVGRLGLQNEAKMKILDIGCGPGYFVAATRALGHNSFGVDIPEHCFTTIEKRTYAELLESLRIRSYVSPLLIERYQPMQLVETGFDLITAFWICFNRHRQADEWGVKEWKFFVDDARTHLKDGGVLHLELNEHPERYGELEWYDKLILKFFRSAGTVDGNRVRISKS